MQLEQATTYYNPIYSSIGACETFFPVIATTATGTMIATTIGISAFYGAGVGFTLGSVDLLANYFEAYDRPYLTSAVLGAGVLNKLSLPYHAAPIAGFIAGLFIPTGILNDHLDKVVAPLSGALHGYSYAGNYGAAAGFTAGVIDESLHSFNISNQYYFSTIVKDIAISNLILPIVPNAINALPAKLGIIRDLPLTTTKFLSKAKEVIGTVYGIYEAYTADKPTEWDPITLAKDIHEVYADIMDEKQLQKTIDNQAIAVVTTSLITQNLVANLAEHYQGTSSCIFQFKDDPESAWNGFVVKFKDVALFLPAYVGGIITTKIINAFFGTNLKYITSDIITYQLTEKETVLKLVNSNNVNNTDANTLIKRKYEDIESLTTKGTELLSDALSSVVKGTFAINYLISINAQDVLLYSIFYNSMTNSLSNYLSTKAGSYDVNITKFTDQKTSLEEYLRVNADSIIQRESNDFICSQLVKIDHNLRTIDGEKTTWTTLNNIWTTAQSINNFLVNYLITAYHLYLRAIDFNVRYKVIFMNEDVYPMLAWSGKNAGEMVAVKQAIDRLNELIDRMNELESKSKMLPEYLYKNAKKQNYWMCFDDLTVGAGDKTLMHIEHQCVDKNVIAVTGESHSGKSTLLKLVKNLKHSLAWGSGKITFYTAEGAAPKIIMASQHYNMPPYVSLLELITLKPRDEAKKLEQQVKDLMTEIRIDYDKKANELSLISLLDEEKDWEQYITSGGARKKLMTIWVMLQNPDIVILDEIFVGIDRDAIQKIQKMLNKYLPNTKFLIVDHEASTHNFDDFYQQNLHVENKTIYLQNLPAVNDHGTEPTQEEIESSSDDHEDTCPALGGCCSDF